MNEKILIAIMSGRQDNNFPFDDLRFLVKQLGFNERIKGDHFILTRDGISEIINIQPVKGKAKPYQVRQVRGIIRKYKLGGI